MQEGKQMEYDKDMETQDWTEGLYKNVSAVKVGVWLLVLLEAAKFVLW